MIRSMLRRIGWRDLCWVAFGLLLVVSMRRSLLSYEQQLAPLLLPATLKERVVTHDFAVTVDGFALARRYRIVDPEAGHLIGTEPVLRTPGVWMSVPVTIERLQTPGFIKARLRTQDGLLYDADSAARPKLPSINQSGNVFDPGLPRKITWFFELPPEKLPGVHLQVYSGAQRPQLDGIVDIDLGIDAQAAAQIADEQELRP